MLETKISHFKHQNMISKPDNIALNEADIQSRIYDRYANRTGH